MTLGENDFLIEAYAASVTDKLTIVEERGGGASHSASVLRECSRGVGFFFQITSIWRCFPSIQFQAQKQALKPKEATPVELN